MVASDGAKGQFLQRPHVPPGPLQTAADGSEWLKRKLPPPLHACTDHHFATLSRQLMADKDTMLCQTAPSGDRAGSRRDRRDSCPCHLATAGSEALTELTGAKGSSNRDALSGVSQRRAPRRGSAAADWEDRGDTAGV